MPTSNSVEAILLVYTFDDTEFLSSFKSCTGTTSVKALSESKVITWSQLATICKQHGITGIATTSRELLKKLLPQHTFKGKKPSIDDYAGSLFTRDGIDIVILNPLRQLVTVPYGSFIARRYISKITQRDSWLELPEFNWCILTLSNIQAEYDKAILADLCAADIETFKKNLAIRCIGFTFLWLRDGVYVSRSVVLSMDEEWAIAWAQKFLSLPCAKILQNGKYDISYLLRYGLILYNYVWDTATLMHCWYSELPKRLSDLSAFFVLRSMYWKDLADTNDREQYYLYNAKDTFQTACVLLAWINEAPSWAISNYQQEFPLLFPCMLAEMRGIKRDFSRLEQARTDILEKILSKQRELESYVGQINTNSAPQVKKLLKILGCADLPSTDEINLKKAIFRHPFNSRILNPILDIRGWRKLISTYLRTDEDRKLTKTQEREWSEEDIDDLDGGAKELDGRILWALNPHGTDTARLASREHHFWCGMQIHNIPRESEDGDMVKSTLISDDGFYLGEADFEQAETWGTAHITGDPTLLENVHSPRYFHAINAESFFGIPYAELYDDALKKKKNKKIIDISKRTNHGANYNMGWAVLLDTMGEVNVSLAQKLLKLPPRWTLREVCEYLLRQFDKTYPVVRGEYHIWIKKKISFTKQLVSAHGWTRYCFGNPTTSKQALNAYVAHVPQNLNAGTLNKAWMRVFALAMKYPNDFKLLAQIHDSILFMYRIGREDLAWKVKELMEIPVTIKDIKGVERTFTVPAALKLGKRYWSELE